MTKYRVLAYDFFEDVVINDLGVFDSYEEALERATESANRFSSQCYGNFENTKVEVFSYTNTTYKVSCGNTDKGALIQVL